MQFLSSVVCYVICSLGSLQYVSEPFLWSKSLQLLSRSTTRSDALCNGANEFKKLNRITHPAKYKDSSISFYDTHLILNIVSIDARLVLVDTVLKSQVGRGFFPLQYFFHVEESRTPNSWILDEKKTKGTSEVLCVHTY